MLSLGVWEARRGDLVRARKLLNRVLVNQPDNSLAMETLGQISEAEFRLQEAKGWYEKALELRPNSTNLKNHLGRVKRAIRDSVRIGN